MSDSPNRQKTTSFSNPKQRVLRFQTQNSVKYHNPKKIAAQSLTQENWKPREAREMDWIIGWFHEKMEQSRSGIRSENLKDFPGKYTDRLERNQTDGERSEP